MNSSQNSNFSEKTPLVSIYTCVYNGERTIHRVFDSIKKLDYPNIEHVIINDGTTDGTEELINAYMQEVSFPVKYHKKENGGKHTALNVAWSISEGRFMVQLDADDELLPHSISFLVETYFSIPEEIRENYWCVHGRCVTQHGDFVGDPYPEEINETNWRIASERASQCGGDKLGLQVAKYLSKYRLPEVKGTSHVAESIVWDQINSEYGTWYTNEVVLVYYVNEGGNLTAAKKHRSQYAPLTYYYKWQIAHPERYGNPGIRKMIKYAIAFHLSHKRYRENNAYFDGIEYKKFWLVLLYIPGMALAFVYRLLKQIK